MAGADQNEHPDLGSIVRPFGDAPDPMGGGDPRPLSLWTGGPLFSCYCRLDLASDGLELLGRRAFVLTTFAWLPLLALTAIDGRAWSGVSMPFLLDIEVQTRLLIALPLLITGELVVHRRMPPAVRQFVDRRIVAHTARTSFDRAIDSALRWGRSHFAEIIMLACVYSLGLALEWRHLATPDIATWYRRSAGEPLRLTPAGWWYLLISGPLLQFLLLRWYFRLFVWGRFLWQVSRLDLKIVPTHPDRRAGLGFLSAINHTFAPFLFAHGVLLAGAIADGVLYSGLNLADYKVELVIVPLTVLALVLGPELAFVPILWNAKRIGLLEYGALAQRYVREFESKWLRGRRSAGEPLVGSADIQSLADLGNSFEIIERMRVVPVTRGTLLRLCVITLLPLAPLSLTVISGRELLERLLKVVF